MSVEKPCRARKEELQADPLCQDLLTCDRADREPSMTGEGQACEPQTLIDITHRLTPEERHEFAEDHAAADSEKGMTVDQAMAFYRASLRQ